jgi:hypothetical protein
MRLIIKAIIATVLLASPVLGKSFDYRQMCSKLALDLNIKHTEVDRVMFMDEYMAVDKSGWFSQVTAKCKHDERTMTITDVDDNILSIIEYNPPKKKTEISWGAFWLFVILGSIIFGAFTRTDEQRARDNWVNHWKNK